MISFFLVHHTKGATIVLDGGSLSFVTLLRFERRTYCLEGSCSIQLSYGASFYLVGIARLERATSCSQSMHTNQLYYIPSVIEKELSHIRKGFYQALSLFCGEGGIRTPGTLIEYDSLANCWFQPLTHLSVAILTVELPIWTFQRIRVQKY